MSRNRLHKAGLLLLAVVLLFGVSRLQNVLNHDRDALGLTRVQPLENAPPVLAFTTVALGGFRGLISNLLWIRASQLQDDDKFFEMQQLADWITKLEPHFAQVWVHEAWNMSYNISVKFKENSPGVYADRWRWVKAGLELLRDEGLKYNPDSVLIYRELAWDFQHKLGANLDDGNMYYKQEWANDMAEVFAKKTPNLDELIHPKTEDEKRRAELLEKKYKMNPVFMKQVNEEYGPLEWRLPEASAIYWAALGLEKAKENPSKVKPDDLIQLRRVIYQSMQLSFQRGRLETDPIAKEFDFGPNLDIIPKVSAAYEQAMDEDKPNRDHIEKAHRNFLRQAVYTLYVNNRIADAAKWFKYLGEKYPNKTIVDGDTNSYPRNLTLDQYAVACVATDINETSRDRVKASIEGMLMNSFRSLIMGDTDRAAGFRLLANKIWQAYDRAIPQDRKGAIGVPSIKQTSEELLNKLLDPVDGIAPEARALLRTQLNMPPETPSTNSPESLPASQTAPATNSTPVAPAPQ